MKSQQLAREAKHNLKGAIRKLEQLLKENTQLSELAIRIMSTVYIAQRIPMTSVLGKIIHISDDIDAIENSVMELVNMNLLNVEVLRSGQVVLVNKMELTKEITESLKRLVQFSYPLPLTCKPRKLTHNEHSPYYTQHHKVIAGHRLNHHSEDINLEHLNRLGNNRFTLDHKLMSEFDELSLMSEKAKDTIQKRQVLQEFLEESERVYKELGDSEFHFAHFKDTRGRFYNYGFHVTYQGNEFKKASLRFAEKRLISKD